ncbi:FecR family protein [Desulfovibrio inopinatus]|uniref:FecR family protein n=1 Tax=Desulfovibrio inopinatus TaxID=102109 RepID=UPI0003F84DE1|nr:FecR domain-containing protein [Desulfovibrio inopinatus]
MSQRGVRHRFLCHLKKATIGLSFGGLVFVLLVSTAHAETLVGYAQELSPEVFAKAQGAQRTLAQRDPVFRDDTVETRTQGLATLEFWDGSVLSMSSDSQVLLSDFVYDPDQAQRARLTVSLAVGTLRFVSGETADPDADHIQIQTPMGFLGIRGTDVAVSVADDNVEVAVFEGGPAFFTDHSGQRRRLLAGRFLRFRRGVSPEEFGDIPAMFRQRLATLAIDRNRTLDAAMEILGQRFGANRRRALAALRAWYARRFQRQNDFMQSGMRQRREERRKRRNLP